MTKIYTLLWRLGVGSTYKGRKQMALAVKKVQENEDYLFSVTKILYPETAKEFHTRSTSIERNFRTIIDACWNRGNRELLDEMAGYHLPSKPTSKQFIGILVCYLNYQESGAQERWF